MKKLLLIIGAMVVMTGCYPDPRAMTNDQVIAETKKCLEAGMRADLQTKRLNDDRRIVCEPINPPSK
jgi:uncharacterized protein YcfL